MDRRGFIDFNTRLSPENSGKAASYAQAIRILDAVLMHQHVVDLFHTITPDGSSCDTVDIPGLDVLEDVRHCIRRSVVAFVHNDHTIILE